ncbi:mRNA turnover protein-like protein 4 [Rhizodiscina lignyota]|uniref:Ribosome assembly factor mrt4 n=1 Tax=Rhizodiscina lignyota TaxID=1504668 RepID=A0A9P4IPT3_9PEZI|nr:mRNA turnover protein-like protein 4 [Rhizodiscina lignyota]
MPKSKRAKVVHLSKVEKKGKELSQKLFDGVREAADQYQYIFVFSVENMRNTYLKNVRAEFSDSRIFFGKTKVMAKSLGSSPEDEYLPNLSQLTPHITGNVGLLFTSRAPSDVIQYFADFSEVDYARAGVSATRTFTIPEGVVYSRGGEVPVEDDEPLSHSLEVTLRKWDMPVRLVKGKVVLDGDYTVCKEGQELNSHQTALLKMFGVAMAEFRVDLKAYWSAASQEVTEVASNEEVEE